MRIGVLDADDSVISAFEMRYGSTVVVEDRALAQADTCSGIGNCWPPKGGIKIKSSYNNAVCTSAFLAKRTDTNKIVVVTAGHCIARNGGSETDWIHSYTVFGVSKNYVWADNKDAEVGIIKILDSVSSGMTTFTEYLRNNSPITVVNLPALQSSGAQAVGLAVCRMGNASGLTCGTITGHHVENESCVANNTICKTLLSTTEVSFDSTGGDSGGAVFSNNGTSNVGYGLHVHSDPDGTPGAHGWFSPLDLARSTLITETGVTIEWCILEGPC